MPIAVNVTEEEIVLPVTGGHFFTFKPGARKNITNPHVAEFIRRERKGSGIAILPDLRSEDELLDPDSVSQEDLKKRELEQASERKEIMDAALTDYIVRLRDVIRNVQVGLRKDAAMAGMPDGYEKHLMSDGTLNAMRLVAKYDRKGKDAAQERLKEIEKLEKEISK